VTVPYFRATVDGFRPDASAHAPWSTEMLHGRLIGGLAARAVEAAIDEPGRRVARLTVDLFRPAGMGPVTLTHTSVRRGRRIEVVDVVVSSGGNDVARATGLVLAVGEEPPGTIWRPPADPWPDPDSLPRDVDDAETADARWWIATVAGGFDSAERTRVWTNDTVPLVDDEQMSPLVRAAISGDLACPLANSGDAGLHYINADYTLTLARYPIGEWIGLEVAQHIAADGLALGTCTLVDVQGPFATSTGSSVTTAPLDTPGGQAST
jgi:acyl-coenzyme A thioesterase PaaI-like protein